MGRSPHSPGAGFASEARAWGVSFDQIRETGRWKVLSQNIHGHGTGCPYSRRAQGGRAGTGLRLGRAPLGVGRGQGAEWHRRAVDDSQTAHGPHRAFQGLHATTNTDLTFFLGSFDGLADTA
eukprot:92372-Pyramimonas_sp.AAC.1